MCQAIADVAAKTVELINMHADGTYVPISPVQAKKHPVQMPAQNNCTECHGDNVPASPGI